ncbi:MAG: phytoene/squalene synthase family protein [Planctomycetes bacterium]|nr:phytoene/squalene synthase family protein [Planctomycetota bacterium]
MTDHAAQRPVGVPTTADLTPALAADFEACRGLVRAHARNFYYGLRLTPEPRRSAVYAVYAWMRTGDDHIDLAGSPEEKQARLDQFARRSERLFAGLTPDEAGMADPVWRAFAWTIGAFPIDRADLRGLLAGLEDDAAQDAGARPGVPVYATRADLERYCYRVAGVVGLICIDIWGLRPGIEREEARRLAALRGLAFQLTNILRDLAEDFDRGRVYVPAEDLRAAGVDPEALRRWSDPDRCDALVRRVGTWARRSYMDSAPLDRMIDPACAPTLWAMTRIYSRLLEKIEAHPRRVAMQRVRVRAIHKAGIAVAAALKARVYSF